MNEFSSLKNLIIFAGEIALTQRVAGLTIEYKEDNSLVTNGDREISKFIYQHLYNLTPDIAIICEEQPLVNLTNDNFWLIDPIDGTNSYVKGESTFTINIGLIKRGEPTLGLIYQPTDRKLYYTDGSGNLIIEHNGKEVIKKHKGSRNILKDDQYVAVISSSSPNQQLKDFLDNNCVNEIINIPSSIKLCMIAEGYADIYPRFGKTMEWDIAAGHALIKATGGDILDNKGNIIKYGKENFVNPSFLAYSKRGLKKFIR